MKFCKDCKHYTPRRVFSCFVGMAVVEAQCRRSDLVGDGYGTKPCVEERATESGLSCGTAARNWEAA